MKAQSNNFRSKTMKRAWSIYRSTTKSFAVCLSIAWRAYKLAQAMKDHIVEFTFEKVDGTLRRAKGTLQVPSFKPSSSNRSENFKSIVYYDVDRQAFRSFRTENLISIL
jgi:hypothetical protein